jgi:hypothetical protein
MVMMSNRQVITSRVTRIGIRSHIVPYYNPKIDACKEGSVA